MAEHSVLERIEIARRAGLAGRLDKGAVAIGKIRHLGMSCSGEWSRKCPCAPKSEFCEAKALWIQLVEDLHGKPPWGLSGDEPFYLAEAMTLRQFDSTGLTIRIMPPEGREEIRIGPRGTDWETLRTLADLHGTEDYAEVLFSVLRIQEVFR